MGLERLSKYTYEVRHNPNCASPFMIVTCGDGAAIYGPRDFTHLQARNDVAYGKSLDEAADAMMEKIEQRHRLQRIRIVERKHTGLVWA